jgi:uncharacterized protein with HEPN domain
MSNRIDEDYLEDMLEASRRAVAFSAGMDFDKFAKDIKTQDAVIRNIEIIGEAARNISENGRNRFTNIPWKQIMGMRDRLIHHYFGANIDIVWGVVKEDLPQLIRNLSAKEFSD